MNQTNYQGLTENEVLESRKKHGENLLTPPPKEPWWELLLGYFEDPIIRILLFAAALSFGIQITNYFQEGHADFFEPIGIVIAVILATCVGFFNEYKANKEFDVLNQFNDTVPVTVIRDGNYIEIPKDEIVVGDLVVLETGMEIPADGDLLEAVSLKISEAKLTGESVPVNKKAKTTVNNKNDEDTYQEYEVLNSTTVADGHGVMEVTAVGDNTEIGKTARRSMETVEGRTPLEQQLDRLAQLINVIGFSFAIAVFLALTLRGILSEELLLTSSQWFFMVVATIASLIAIIPVWLSTLYDLYELLDKDKEYPESLEGFKGWAKTLGAGLIFLGIGLTLGTGLGHNFSNLTSGNFMIVLQEFLMYFMIAVTLIVVAVPEGLPLSTTIALAYSMRKMMKENVLTKKMIACETMGAVTTICTDKTGTLTRNEMRVFAVDFPYLLDDLEQPEEIQKMIMEAMAVNSTANLDKTSNEAKVIGNPTEGALLLHLDEEGFDYNQYRSEFKIKGQIPFHSENKYMATYGTSKVLDKNVVYVKGAPEILLEYCQNILAKGENKPIDGYLATINDKIKDYQKRGMRVLGFAYEEAEGSLDSNMEEVSSSLTWLGFAIINDPVRADVQRAIDECKQAGIEVKIVTGDNALTASEIGRQVNIIEDDKLEEGLVVGGTFRKLAKDKLIEVVDKLKVLSRAKPEDKLTLVKTLKEMGKVVAVTGDGTNDAPAMNYSNIGIAMGKTGTSVAKETADMVLLDDSFSSIVKGVKWGRSLYQNIQRFILFQLTINVVALLIALIGPFLGVSLPLTVVQMLWVNLIMDTFAALALSTEPPHDEVMKDKPRDPKSFIINQAMTRSIFGVGIIFVIVLIGLLLYFNQGGMTEKELTLFFSTFILLQFWNMFNARCLGLKQSAFKGLSENTAFVGIALAILVGQILMVQFGGEFFRTVPLSFNEWLTVIGGTSIVLWIGEIKRLFLNNSK